MLERPMTTPDIPAQHSYVPTQLADAKTKALLATLTEQAPALAGLLDKALKDGVIAADTERPAWVTDIDRASQRLRDTTLTADVNRLGTLVAALSAEAARIERVVTPPPPVAVTDWRLTRWAFFAGVAVGACGIGWLLLHR